jgi:phosphatidylserine/phosphatidylglycerophosphate/cardiolipin synthase-like enzyme
MRFTTPGKPGDFRAHVIAGTRVILIALDLSQEKAKGLAGFAFKREPSPGHSDWLTGLKVFKSLEPNPKPNAHYSTSEDPIQSFLWSDYTASPATTYKFTVAAMYGHPGALEPKETLRFDVTTEPADDGKHGIWFNRGSIASQAFAKEFDNAAMTDAIANDPDNKMTIWLSRGLLEAYVDFLNKTPSDCALRVCAYEFTYKPFLIALKSAMKRGVDVKVVYQSAPANQKAINAVGLPADEQKMIKRTRPPIPHNKFIVRLDKHGKPVSVLTGSTNFTPSGFLGQTNVGHLVTDDAIAKTYLAFWTALSGNPTKQTLVPKNMALSPNPANLIPSLPVTPVFSARSSSQMLNWYSQRVVDGATSAVFTGAFGVDAKILAGLESNKSAVRFILLEKPPTSDVRSTQKKHSSDIRVSYGAVLGQTYEKKAGAHGVKKLVPIPKFELDKWFLKEELARRDGSGFVFFIHTKFLLIDPLSDDPLVCTGSANFSANSLNTNDENMLLIRGNTRVADIYLTEFDRIFRHFYFRDVANEVALRGGQSKTVFLDESGKWVDEYFDSHKFNCHRRQMFFAGPNTSWADKAPLDKSPFSAKIDSGKGKIGAKKGKKKAKKTRQKSSTKKKKKSSRS